MIFPINKEGKLENTRMIGSNNNNTYTRHFNFDFGFFKIQPVTRDNDHSIVYGGAKSSEPVNVISDDDNSCCFSSYRSHSCLKHLLIIIGIGCMFYAHMKKNKSK